MNRQQFTVFVDADLVSQTVDVERALACTIGHAVVVATDRDLTFVAHAPLEPDHAVEGAGRQRLQSGTLLAEVLSDDAVCGAVHADIGDRVEPLAQLAVQVGEVLEAARQEEFLPDIALRPLDLALGLGAIRLAGARREAVVLRKRDQLRVVDDVLLDFAQHGRLHGTSRTLTLMTSALSLQQACASCAAGPALRCAREPP